MAVDEEKVQTCAAHQEIEKLTKENTYLQAKLTKLADIHEAVLAKLIENIYDLEKQKILTKGYQKGLTKSLQKICKLEKDFQHIEYCLRIFDTFCNNSICPAAQTFSVSGKSYEPPIHNDFPFFLCV